jgi:hypothetical protein
MKSIFRHTTLGMKPALLLFSHAFRALAKGMPELLASVPPIVSS